MSAVCLRHLNMGHVPDVDFASSSDGSMWSIGRNLGGLTSLTSWTLSPEAAACSESLSLLLIVPLLPIEQENKRKVNGGTAIIQRLGVTNTGSHHLF